MIVLFFLFFQVAAVSGNKQLAELIRNFTDKDIGTLYNEPILSPQIIFFSKQIICQSRDSCLPGRKSISSDNF